MKINKISFKNFTSYGNNIQTIEFDDKQSNLYIVSGLNGSGKSSLAKVITYLLYDKVENTLKRDLPNRINKNLWGKIWITSKGNEIQIERGLKPNVFKVFVNGENYDVAGKSNLQEFLETEIYDIPYEVFKNIIILSINDFKSFLTMTPSDKKLIIDKIFGFSIINEMKEVVKTEKKSLLSDYSIIENDIKNQDSSIQSIIDKIEEQKKKNKERENTDSQKIKDSILKLSKKRSDIKDNIKEKESKLNEYENELQNLLEKKTQLSYNIDGTKESLNLYKERKCPTCKSSLDTDFHLKNKNDLQNSLKNNQDELEKIHLKIKEQNKNINEIKDIISNLRNDINECESSIISYKNQIKNISNENDSSISNYKELIKEFSNKRKDSKEKRKELEDKINYNKTLEFILGDGGIKFNAIKIILPKLNRVISEMSNEIGIPFQLKFDENFNCNIYHLGIEVNPKTLSTGERKKSDFVIIMSLIKLIKMRYPGLNILFLDEIFSSVDSNGVHHIIGILNRLIKELNLNTFVINHTVLPSEYFDKNIFINKDSGFSQFNIENIN